MLWSVYALVLLSLCEFVHLSPLSVVDMSDSAVVGLRVVSSWSRGREREVAKTDRALLGY